MENFLFEYWYYFAGAAMTAAWWIIRKVLAIESKVCQHDKAITDIQSESKEEVKKLNNKLDQLFDKVSDLAERISGLAGYLKRCEEERNP